MMAMTSTIQKLDISLSGEDNQAVRCLIRSSQLRFTAINDSGIPFLTELLPLATQFATIKNALLALAKVLRTDSSRRSVSSSSAVALESYHIALKTLRERIAILDVSEASDADVLEVLGAALLLTIAGFPGSSQDSTAWSHHIVGLITLIESLGPSAIDATVLGTLVKEIVAYLDISAFSLGRPPKSRNAWLRWHIHPPETPPTDDFTSLEVAVGYPRSLLTIIATLSAIFDGPDEDTMPILSDLLERLYSNSTGGLCQPIWPAGSELSHEDGIGMSPGVFNKLDAALTLWNPPYIPKRLPEMVSIALAGAWEIMRKAALLYLWRGGFRANILAPLPAEKTVLVSKLIREMLFGYRALLTYLENDSITILNVMTWPLVVVGNECGGDHRTQHEVSQLISLIQESFQIQHLSHVSNVLEELWRRHEAQSESFMTTGQAQHLCLNDVSNDMGVCVPLF
nr:uncharacterized protein CTRU02_00597 [Colletotrichum truncatum]KAF6801848.1 hypothetical protein CTRU02_00597 [Colletotrichum truncatum]